MFKKEIPQSKIRTELGISPSVLKKMHAEFILYGKPRIVNGTRDHSRWGEDK